MIRIAIAGAGGRMGARIVDLAASEKDIKVTALFERKDFPLMGAEVLPGIKITGELGSLIEKFDVLIDFTSPGVVLENLKQINNSGIAAVIGTTGLSSKELDELKEYSVSIPMVFSPNMSIGVNVLFNIVRRAAKLLNGYDVEIVEAHHNKKKDSPSGTALRLAECAAESMNCDLSKSVVYGRSGKTGERKKDEIGIHSIRAGDIIGEHSVFFAGPGECVEIAHKAYSRDTFAKGALKAALWIFGKKPGLYSMTDVLGL